jgi:sialidase-1
MTESFTLYRSDLHYCAHPTVCRATNGDLLAAFRLQPNRRRWPGIDNIHIDVDSCAAISRSTDNGTTWSDAVVVHKEPGVGDNDPCITDLSNGRILMTFFRWHVIPGASREEVGGPNFTRDYHKWHKPNPWPGIFIMKGACVIHSDDDGWTWSEPRDVAVPERFHGGRCAIQGKATELADGRVLLPVYATTGPSAPMQALALISEDRGESFSLQGVIAEGFPDKEYGFGENSVLALANGDVVSFLRPEGDKEQPLWVSRSSDLGRTWEAEQVEGVKGVPQKAIHLSDGRVFLVYGYRFDPDWGVRARILDPDCRNIGDAEEIIIRDDGNDTDLGYPDAVEVEPGRVLVVYYFNDEVSDCRIDASWVDVGEG